MRKYNKKGLRAPVSYITKKSNDKCPVHIVRTKESDGSYTMSGSLAPHSHTVQLASTFLPRIVKMSILSELQKGVGIKEVLRKTRQKFPHLQVKLTNIRNLLSKIKRNYIHDKNDIVSTSVIADLNKALFFKMVMPNQEAKFTYVSFKPGDLRCIPLPQDSITIQLDSTHCTTKYGFYLTTLLIIDDQNHGWPAFHLISSDEKEITIHDFMRDIFTDLRNIMGEKKIFLITDDYIAYFNAFTKVFGKNFDHILCRWHIKKNLKKNLNSKQESKTVKNLVLNLAAVQDIEKFNCIIAEIKKQSSDQFWAYFNSNYLNRKEKWVAAFIKCKNYYNMHIESFHNLLKRIHFGYKRNTRCDKLVQGLFDIFEEKKYCLKTRKLTKSYSNKQRIIHGIHHQMTRANISIDRIKDKFFLKVI